MTNFELKTASLNQCSSMRIIYYNPKVIKNLVTSLFPEHFAMSQKYGMSEIP